MIPGLSQEQSKQLLQFISNLIGTINTKSVDASASAAHMVGIHQVLNVVHSFCALSHDIWILDSGASERISSKQEFLHDVSKLTYPIMVNMPNGMRVKVTHKGKLRVSPDLVLNHVLLIPHFKFNLLSIKRLCEQLKCMVQFTESVCTIQGPSLKRPLVIGRDQVGLYVLDKEANQNWELQTGNQGTRGIAANYVEAEDKLTCGVTFDIWHRRLGHMSDLAMKLIPVIDILSNKNKMEICDCLLYTSPSPRDGLLSRMPSSA